MGECYEYGIGTDKSAEDAFRCFQVAAKDGFIPALKKIGEAFETGSGVEKSDEKAQAYKQQVFKRYEKGADNDNPHDQAVLGRLYEKGEGVEQSYAKAIHYYQISADQNNSLGQYSLAECYADGKGVPKSPEKAVYYYKKAADQGYLLAIAELGKYLLKNQIDEEEGLKYLNLAIQKASDYDQERLATLQLDLAEYYDNVKKSADVALHYYILAADNGNKFAQESLGDAYREGSLGLTKIS